MGKISTDFYDEICSANFEACDRMQNNGHYVLNLISVSEKVDKFDGAEGKSNIRRVMDATQWLKLAYEGVKPRMELD